MSLASYFFQKAAKGRGLERRRRSSGHAALNSVMQISDGGVAGAQARAVRSRADRSSLYDLVRSQDWQAASERALSHRHECRLGWRQLYSMTSLHWVCCNDPPLAMVRTLVRICPEALLAVDGDGNFPLHVACHWGNTTEVVSFLIEAGREHCVSRLGGGEETTEKTNECNDSGSEDIISIEVLDPCRRLNHNGETALHLACQSQSALAIPSAETVRLVARFYPEAVLIRESSQGMTPIHFACNRGERSADILRPLLEVSTPLEMLLQSRLEEVAAVSSYAPVAIPWTPCHTLLIRDGEGRTPAQLFFSHYTRSFESFLGLAQNALEANTESRDVIRAMLEEEESLRLCVEVMALFTRGAHRLVVRGTTPPVMWSLHDCCYLGTMCCPEAYFKLVLSICRDEVLSKDEDGNIPLHLACASDPVDPGKIDDSKRNGSMRPPTSVSFVPQLLSLHPESARVADRRGRLPLHIGAESNVPWELRRVLQSCGDGDDDGDGAEDSPEGCLRWIFEAEPRAVMARDPKTGLYPFALAACHPHSQNGSAAGVPVEADEVLCICPSEHSSGVMGSHGNGATTARKSVGKKEETTKCDSVLTACFELLRAAPSVLENMMISPG